MTSRRIAARTARVLLRGAALAALLLLLGGWSWFWTPGDQEAQSGHPLEWFGHGWSPGEAPLRPLFQSHKLHVQQEELACTDCHTGAVDKDRAGFIDMEGCAECHDEAVEPEKSDPQADRSGCLLCHRLEQPIEGCNAEACPESLLPKFELTLGPTPYPNLRYADQKAKGGADAAQAGADKEEHKGGFSHRTHAKAEIGCADCHGAIAEEEGEPFPSGKYMPTAQRCLDCHAKDLGRFTHQAHEARKVACEDCHEEKIDAAETPAPGPDFRPSGLPTATPQTCQECHEPVSDDCSTCHIESGRSGSFAKGFAPQNHGQNWKRMHGAVAQLNEKEIHGKDCATCHAQSECDDCHANEEPRDHTPFWSGKGHGLMAAGDTQRCENCHKQDTCVACHNETAPRSHIGSWDQGSHCGWCHLDASVSGPAEGCRACHQLSTHVTSPHAMNAGTADCLACHNPVTGKVPAP